MATFKNELTLDAKQHNSEMNSAANSVRNYDKQIRTAEKGTREYLATQKKNAMQAKAHAKELDVMSGRLSSVAKAFGAGGTSADLFGSILTKGLGSALKFTTVLAGITGALKVAKDAFFSSESNVDDWGRTVAAAESTYNSFVSGLNSGNFSGFISNLNNVITTAREAYNALDDLNTMMTIINPERAKYQSQVNKQRDILSDPTSTKAQKDAAKKELQRLKPLLEKSFQDESKMNETYVRAELRKKLAEGGINLDKNSFEYVFQSLSDSNKFKTLKANAKTTYSTTPVAVSDGYGHYTYQNQIVETKNTNQKISDILNDEWLQGLQTYVNRIYTASAEGYAQGNSINRALSRASGGGSNGGGGNGGTSTTPKAEELKYLKGSVDDWKAVVNALTDKLSSGIYDKDETEESIKQMLARAKIMLEQAEIEVGFKPIVDLNELNLDDLQERLKLFTTAGDTEGAAAIQKVIDGVKGLEQMKGLTAPELSGYFSEDQVALDSYKATLKGFLETFKEYPKIVELLTKKLAECDEKQQELNKDIAEQAKLEYEDQLEKFQKATEDYKKANDDLTEGIKNSGAGVETFTNAWGNLLKVLNDENASPAQKIQAFTSAISNSMNAILQFNNALSTIETAMQNMSNASSAASTAMEAAHKANMKDAAGEASVNSMAALGIMTKDGAKLGFPQNIVAIAAAVTAVMGVLGAIASIAASFNNGGIVPKFADGGLFSAASTVGDHNLARVNGGEMILNPRQQSHLFNMINKGNSSNTFEGGGKVEFKIKGKELVGVLNNYNKQQSKI